MVFYRRRRAGGRKGPMRKRPGRKYLKPRRRYGMSKRGIVRVFTETLSATDLLCTKDLGSASPGQQWGISMSAIPQLKNYQALYAQYKILKIKWRFIPEFNSYEKNQALTNLGSGGQMASMPTLAYAISTDPKSCAVPPASELDVLTQNYSKVRALGVKPFNITIYKPQPDINATTLVSPGVTGPVALDKTSWFSLNNNTTVYPSAGDPTLIQHWGLQTFVTCADNSSYSNPVARVYCDITFALREAI